MKPKLDQALTKVAFGVVTALASLSAQATVPTAYEIVNFSIDETTNAYVINGQLSGTQRGYATGISEADQSSGQVEIIGYAQGRKNLNEGDADVENDDVLDEDFDFGITAEDAIVYNVLTDIQANNFAFTLSGNSSAAQSGQPTFAGLNGAQAPTSDATEGSRGNGIDSIFYAISHAGDKVGVVSGQVSSIDNTVNEDYDKWYYREFESRGYLRTAAGVDIQLLPVEETMSYGEETSVNIGGWSVAANISDDGKYAVGYVSTEISDSAKTAIDSCLEDSSAFESLDVCIQDIQFDGRMGYQLEPALWILPDATSAGTTEVEPITLALSIEEDEISALNVGQALGVNTTADNGLIAVGRTYAFTFGRDFEISTAAYWTIEADAETGTATSTAHIIPMPDEEYYNTVALDVSAEGVIVGTYDRYIDGYLRTKFFTYDLNNTAQGIVTVNDVNGQQSDIAMAPTQVNGNYAVGTMDTDGVTNISRTKSGFIYDLSNPEKAYNVDRLLTCSSKTYEQDADSKWAERAVTVTDSSGKEFTYYPEVRIAQITGVTADAKYLVGTALISKPVFKLDEDRYPTGEFELNGAGNPLTAFSSEAVLLAATTEEACDYIPPSSDDAPFERQGAAAWWMLLLAPLAFWRRRQG